MAAQCSCPALRSFNNLNISLLQLKDHISSFILKCLLLLSCLALCWLLSGPPGTLSNNLILHATPLGPLLFRHQGQFYIFPQISSRIFVTVKFPLFVPGLFCNMFLVVLLTPEPTTPPSRVSSFHFSGTGKLNYVTCL